MRERVCASCRTTKKQEDLIKITRIKNDEIIINPSSKQFGRSLYVCKDKDCIEKLIKNCRIEKNLKLKNNVDTQKIKDELNQYIETNLP